MTRAVARREGALPERGCVVDGARHVVLCAYVRGLVDRVAAIDGGWFAPAPHGACAGLVIARRTARGIAIGEAALDVPQDRLDQAAEAMLQAAILRLAAADGDRLWLDGDAWANGRTSFALLAGGESLGAHLEALGCTSLRRRAVPLGVDARIAAGAGEALASGPASPDPRGRPALDAVARVAFDGASCPARAVRLAAADAAEVLARHALEVPRKAGAPTGTLAHWAATIPVWRVDARDPATAAAWLNAQGRADERADARIAEPALVAP